RGVGEIQINGRGGEARVGATILGDQKPARPRESGDPEPKNWMPAFAGMSGDGCEDKTRSGGNTMKMKTVAAVAASLAFATPALAVDWNFYHHQSAPLFATSRGAKMLSEQIEKDTNGELKARLHLSGTLQIAPNNITPAVAEGVVQLADDLFNSGNIPVAGIPRLPGLVRTLDEFRKTADALRPYLEKAFAEKGIVMLADYTYPLQVVWGKKKLTTLDDFK